MFARQKRYDVDGHKIAIGVNDYFQQSLPTPEVRGSNAVIDRIDEIGNDEQTSRFVTSRRSTADLIKIDIVEMLDMLVA